MRLFLPFLLLHLLLVHIVIAEEKKSESVEEELQEIKGWIQKNEPSSSRHRVKVHQPDSLAFLHIPKTGGEYVERLFHLKKNHDVMSPLYAKKLKRKFVFTVLRDPLSRAVSWYNFCRSGYHGVVRNLPRPHTECQQARELDLDAFLLLVFVTTSYTETQHMMRNTYDDYLCLNNAPLFQYALHFESLEEDMQHLLLTLNHPSFVNYTRQEEEVNASAHLKTPADVHPVVRQLFTEARHNDYVMYEHNHRFHISASCVSGPKHPLAFQYHKEEEKEEYPSIACIQQQQQ